MSQLIFLWQVILLCFAATVTSQSCGSRSSPMHCTEILWTEDLNANLKRTTGSNLVTQGFDDVTALAGWAVIRKFKFLLFLI